MEEFIEYYASLGKSAAATYNTCAYLLQFLRFCERHCDNQQLVFELQQLQKRIQFKAAIFNSSKKFETNLHKNQRRFLPNFLKHSQVISLFEALVVLLDDILEKNPKFILEKDFFRYQGIFFLKTRKISI